MYLNKNELTLLYNGSLQKGKQTLAIAHSISNHINKQDITSVRISQNLFCVLVGKLRIKPKDLVNKSDPYYQKELKNKAYRPSEWYHILKNHPELFINPIAIFQGKGIICNTPTDILKIT
jgi:arsenate reductase